MSTNDMTRLTVLWGHSLLIKNSHPTNLISTHTLRIYLHPPYSSQMAVVSRGNSRS